MKVHMVRSETKLVDRNEKETQAVKQGIPVHTWRNSSEGNRKENRIIHVAEKRQTKNGEARMGQERRYEGGRKRGTEDEGQTGK